MSFRCTLLLLSVAIPWGQVPAQEVAKQTFRVSARVKGLCAMDANDVSFGTHSARSGSQVQGAPLLQATCTPEASYYVTISEGRSPGASVERRRMQSDASQHAVDYQLYSDASRSTVWGAGTNAVTGVGTGAPLDHAVFGVMAPAELVPAETYSDTVSVRIFY
jgi:spore coat protein U-like protein